MRASPPFQVSVTRFGVWRIGVVGLSALAAATLVAWLASRDEFTALGWQIAVGAGGAVLVAGSLALARIAPLSLRWDSEQWHLGPAATAGDEPWPGKLAVALDLGSWMLLRFEHESASRRRRFSWLPIQRSGLEPHWHALRCAVYCARSAPARDAGPNIGSSPESQE
jgi:hypothetical protein